MIRLADHIDVAWSSGSGADVRKRAGRDRPAARQLFGCEWSRRGLVFERSRDGPASTESSMAALLLVVVGAVMLLVVLAVVALVVALTRSGRVDQG